MKWGTKTCSPWGVVVLLAHVCMHERTHTHRVNHSRDHMPDPTVTTSKGMWKVLGEKLGRPDETTDDSALPITMVRESNSFPY